MSEQPKQIAYYDTHYAHFKDSVVADVRTETYGEDIGQNSWVTVDEYRQFIAWLGLTRASHVLDVASGSGGPALFLSRETGCQVTGIDMNEHGVTNGNRLARERGLEGRVSFQHADASQRLPFAHDAFDAIVCIDAINHLPDRLRVLTEWKRVLRPGAPVIFTDPIIVTGILNNQEIAIRSSVGFFLFTPQGVDERIIASAGLDLLHREDVTESMAEVAGRFCDARARRRDALVLIEGVETFEGQQKFFTVARTLAAERRLSRFVFHARKPQTRQ